MRQERNGSKLPGAKHNRPELRGRAGTEAEGVD